MSTETTVTSYGSRVSSAFKGIAVGAIICVVAVVCLFKNEGRTIHEAKKLKEGKSVAVSVDAGAIDPANEDKLIHVADNVVTDEVLTDADFHVSTNALVLKRNVEMYQWQEETQTETRRLGGGKEETTTTYSYKKVWSSQLIDSSNFHDAGYDNPTSFPCESQELYASTATLGAFTLSNDQIKNLGPEVKFDPTQDKGQPTPSGAEENAAPAEAPAEEPATITQRYQAAPTNEAFAQQQDDAQIQISTDPAPIDVSVPQQPASTGDISISVNSDAPATENVASVGTTEPATESSVANLALFGGLPAGAVPYQGGYYVGNPQAPKIGDARVTFSRVTTPCPTSVVAQQHGDLLIPYQTQNGPLLLQQQGILSCETMFANAEKANKMMAWIIRLVGTLFIFIGLKMVFAPIEVIADFVPFASKLVGFGTSALAICFTVFLALGAISVGWIYYRPYVGIPLLVVAIGAPIYLFIRGKKRPDSAALPTT